LIIAFIIQFVASLNSIVTAESLKANFRIFFYSQFDSHTLSCAVYSILLFKNSGELYRIFV